MACQLMALGWADAVTHSTWTDRRVQDDVTACMSNGRRKPPAEVVAPSVDECKSPQCAGEKRVQVPPLGPWQLRHDW